MRILITGATGYIGSRLCYLLSQNPENEIVSLQRTNTKYLNNATIINWNLCKPIDETVLPEVDIIIHLALAQNFKSFPDSVKDLYEVNVRSTIELLEFARKVGVSHFFLASTGNSYAPDEGLKIGEMPQPPNDFYTSSKLAAEALCRPYRSCFSVNVSRFFFPYGPNQDDKTVQRLIARVREGAPISLGKGLDGNGDLLSLIYIDDLVDVIKQSIEGGWNGLFDIAASEVISVRQISNEIGRQLGVDVIFEEANFSSKKMVADLSFLNEKNKTSLRCFSEGLLALLEAEKLINGA